MTQFWKLMGIAMTAVVVGVTMGVAVQAARSPAVIARARLAEGLRVAQASKIAEGSRHTCVDLKEGTFDWRWPMCRSHRAVKPSLTRAKA